MDNVNYFKDFFESIHDYKRIVLLIFLIQNDKNLLKEIGFSKNDINLLNNEFKKFLLEEFEEYLSYIKNKEESLLEKFSNKQMEAYFNTIFEDVRHERSIILILSVIEPSILSQSKFPDHEIEITKVIALEKLHRQRNLKEIVALDLLQRQFSD